MIREIRIRNLALIDDLTLQLDQGFTVFTGETGTGKSILVGAISLLLGERASSESVRSGSDEAHVTGLYELPALAPSLRRVLEDNEIPVEDGSLIVRRTIARTGRNRIHINQVPVPLATLKAVGEHLVDLHGQHEHQSLLRVETARRLVDSLPGVTPAAREYAEAYRAFIEASSALETHDRLAVQLAERREVVEFQYRELSSMELGEDEEQELEQEYALLSSATERIESVSRIAALIEGEGEGSSLEHAVAEIRRLLTALEKHDSRAAPWRTEIEGLGTTIAELGVFCSSYLEDTGEGASPDRLDRLNARLAKIQRLKKKHGCDYAGLLRKRSSLKADLDSMENSEADRAVLERKLADARAKASEAGVALGKARRKAAETFDERITKQMQRLGFTGGQWRTVFTPQPELTVFGLEDTAFEVQTNIGEPFLSLIKTASGGEISRLMLAVKTVLAAEDRIPVLIFDEIDTGVGGMLAKDVAEALAELSRGHQVLCISHLHQIAAAADHHVRVFKATDGGRTVTRAAVLIGEEKVREVARMLGDDSELAQHHARKMLEKR